MNPFDLGPRVAFQPPSDANASGGGGSGKRVMMVLGVGCGVILIIIGLLVAAGTFQAVSCCSDVKKIADVSVGAEQKAGEFANKIHAGEVDAAYALTTDAYKKKMTLDAFKSAVQAHRERMSQTPAPVLFNMQLVQDNAEAPSLESLAQGSWLMSYQFTRPKDETMLLLNFHVRSVDAEDGTKSFAIDEVMFDERARNLALEPPALEVVKVHELLQRSQYEMAYMRMGDQFRQSSDAETFRAFLKDTGDILTSSTLEIREVGYNETGTQASVVAHARSSSGKDALIQFELKPMQQDMPGFGWRIVTIAPLVAETDAQAAATAEESNDAPAAPKADAGAEPDAQ